MLLFHITWSKLPSLDRFRANALKTKDCKCGSHCTGLEPPEWEVPNEWVAHIATCPYHEIMLLIQTPLDAPGKVTDATIFPQELSAWKIALTRPSACVPRGPRPATLTWAKMPDTSSYLWQRLWADQRDRDRYGGRPEDRHAWSWVHPTIAQVALFFSAASLSGRERWCRYNVI